MAVHRIKKGLDIPLAGAPEQKVQSGPSVTRVAVVAADFIGMKPRMRVELGDEVKRGQALFEDRKREGVVHTSPAAGTVVAIHRGDKRALQSFVIELSEGERSGQPGPDELQSFESYVGSGVSDLTREQVVGLLAESGLWTALRTRPFSRVPAISDAAPRAIYVTAMDTNPCAPDLDVALAGCEDDFANGLEVLKKLADKVYVCRKPGSKLGGNSGVQVEEFEGPHPAGNVGTHIHTLDPVFREKTAWHLGAQDVAAFGQLFSTGVLPVRRVVAVGGPGVKKPQLLETRLGASTDQLLAGNLVDGELRAISGSVLSGTTAAGEVHGYLGRYHQQISVLAEGRNRDFLGWLTPGAGVWSTMPTFLSAWIGGGKKWNLTTNSNGSLRSMTPIGRYENVFPLDILPTHLLRSCLSMDTERAEALGVLELDEEDVALCTVVCPNKNEFGPALRKVLNTIEAEG
jgi:Na+-transporting NADH:ubiquinone oxidoreductase subunit A